VGRAIAEILSSAGWQVVHLTKSPRSGSTDIPFDLNTGVDASALIGCDALVHCAYDFGPRSRADIWHTNVEGSRKLLEAAAIAGVGRIVVISSMSSFDGCHSLYGQAKQAIEQLAREYRAWVLRPGLVFGSNSGGMVGSLEAQIAKSPFQPVPNLGKQLLYLVHEEDLAEAVRIALDKREPWREPVTIAHSTPWEFRSLLRQMASRLHRTIRILPVPWRLLWLPIRALEAISPRTRLRSDSLVSLVNQNSLPVFNAGEALRLECRPYSPSV